MPLKEVGTLAKPCSVCIHADTDKINTQLIEGIPLDTLAKTYGLATSSLQRHKKHIPPALAKTQEAQEIAAADNLMGRIAGLDAKAEDIYQKAIKADNLSAAIGAVRELRGVTELYAKITGELSAQSVTNIIVAPEWVSLRNVILVALDPYPEARRAVIEAVGSVEA